jgi:hypothetical protein
MTNGVGAFLLQKSGKLNIIHYIFLDRHHKAAQKACGQT